MSGMAGSENAYTILGLEPDPALDESHIKKAYRRLAVLKHPDKNPDNGNAAEEFAQLERAYRLLLDRQARSALDAQLRSREEADATQRHTRARPKPGPKGRRPTEPPAASAATAPAATGQARPKAQPQPQPHAVSWTDHETELVRSYAARHAAGPRSTDWGYVKAELLPLLAGKTLRDVLAYYARLRAEPPAESGGRKEAEQAAGGEGPEPNPPPKKTQRRNAHAYGPDEDAAVLAYLAAHSSGRDGATCWAAFEEELAPRLRGRSLMSVMHRARFLRAQKAEAGEGGGGGKKRSRAPAWTPGEDAALRSFAAANSKLTCRGAPYVSWDGFECELAPRLHSARTLNACMMRLRYFGGSQGLAPAQTEDSEEGQEEDSGSEGTTEGEDEEEGGDEDGGGEEPSASQGDQAAIGDAALRKRARTR